MKVAHILIGVLLFLCLVAGCLFILWTALKGEESWAGWLNLLLEKRLVSVLSLVGMLLMVLLFALTAIQMPERVQYLAYDTEGGAVSISLKAVEDFVAKLADEFAAVVSLQPHLKAAGGGVDVQMDVKIKAGAQIPELCKMLQDRTRACIRDKVGLSEVREVRVRVQEIVGPSAADATADGRGEGYA
jgi:uncharacterized alkaline shock family protein YloU